MRIITILSILICLFLQTETAEATVLYQVDFEPQTCNVAITDGASIGTGSLGAHIWDIYFDEIPNSTTHAPIVRCSVAAPSGSNYLEQKIGDWGQSTSVGAGTLTDSTKSWTVDQWLAGLSVYTLIDSAGTGFPITSNTATTLTVSGGNPAAGSYTIAGQHDAGIEVTSLGDTVNSGDTRYLATYFRVERKEDRNPWPTDVVNGESFDKLFELGLLNFRHGIGTGNLRNHPASSTQYTAIWWCAQSQIPACDALGNGDDHSAHNVAPYSSSSPFYMQYGRWYALVLKVVAVNSGSGSADLWINGIHLTTRTTQTMNAASVVNDRLFLNGTISQPGYQGRGHIRQMDKLTLATAEADVAEFMSDPEGGGGGALSIRGTRRGGMRR